MDPFTQGTLGWYAGLIGALVVAVAGIDGAWIVSRRGRSQLTMSLWVTMAAAAVVYLVMVLSIQTVY